MKRLILVAILIAVAVVMLPRNAQAAGYSTIERINFAPGAISATRYGAMTVNGTDQWILKISAGQTLTVRLSPTYGYTQFSVFGANGTHLGNGTTYWSGVVPATQDYYITVSAYNNTAPTYMLTVTAPPAPVPAPQRRQIDGTFDSNSYIVELNQAIGCLNAQCPIMGRLIHITAGSPEITNLNGSANTNTGAVSFSTDGGQYFNGTMSANSQTLSGTLSGAGWITFTRR
jgi:hypothetical protein